MLTSLHIENIAVIRAADIDFTRGFCVLTGETGAGKSLLIDSINLLAGGRISRELIRTGEDKALVSAVFTVETPALAAALSDLGIDPDEGEVMLQRVITRDGKSGARINGRAVTQGLLRDVSELLVNIHGQSDNQKLMQASSHLSLLDDYAGDGRELLDYATLYAEWKAVRDEASRLRRDVAERIRLRDMLEYQIQDIDAAKLRAGEEEKLLARRDILRHQEKIDKYTSLALRALREGEKATVVALLDKAELALNQISGVLPQCGELAERLSSLKFEAEDVADSLRALCDADVGDPTAELDRIEGRLEIISRLGRKYGEGVEAILAFRREAGIRLHEIDTADERIEELEAQERALAAELTLAADKLTAVRTAAAGELSVAVQEALTFLDMPKVKFAVSVKKAESFTPQGLDSVEFMISTNPGEPLLPMIRIASGGELSRIMLALRSVLNEKYGVPTSIYDEIDTGISGRTARKVGIKLSEIAGNSQVVCVTHSAQIASLADTHYIIEKKQGGERSETGVRALDGAERVDEIARILGGLNVTENQRAAAVELIRERGNL